MRSHGGMARLLGGVALIVAAAVAGTLAAQEPPIALPPVIGDPVVPTEPLAAEPREASEPESPIVRIPAAPEESGAVGLPVGPAIPLVVEPPTSAFEATPEPASPVEVPVPPVVAPAPPVPPLVETALRSQSVEELGNELQTLRAALGERQILLETRERELGTLREGLLAEMKTLEGMQDTLDARWMEADSAFQAAQAMLVHAEAGCLCTPAPAAAVAEVLPEGAPALPTPEEEREKRVVQVVAIIKTMPPEAAAKVIQSWDDGMASMALSRLPARIASKVVASLPPEHAARLTANMIRGNATVGGMP